MASVDDFDRDAPFKDGLNVGFELGRDDAVQDALRFLIQNLGEFLARYPWLWSYGDGFGGWIRSELEDVFVEVGLPRAVDMQTRDDSRPKRKPLKKADIIAAMQRSGGVCVACGSPDALQVDHIVPVAKGGGNDHSNLQMLCYRCNASKGAKTMDEWQGDAA